MPFKDPEKRKAWAKEYSATYRKENVDTLKLSKSISSKKNYDTTKNTEKHRKYRLANPEAYMITAARKRAKELGIEFALVKEDIVIPSLCPVLNIPLIIGQDPNGDRSFPNVPTLDRIDSSKGYTKDNVWVISWRANRLKSDASLAELELLVEAVRKVWPSK